MNQKLETRTYPQCAVSASDALTWRRNQDLSRFSNLLQNPRISAPQAERPFPFRIGKDGIRPPKTAAFPPAGWAPPQQENEFDRTKLYVNTHTFVQSRKTQTHAQSADCPLPRDFPDPEQEAKILTLHVVDVLNGQRPLRQLRTWLTPAIYQALARRAELGQKLCGGPAKCGAPRIRAIRVFRPRPRIAEACAVVFDGRKTRAAALRLAAQHRHWHIHALEII